MAQRTIVLSGRKDLLVCAGFLATISFPPPPGRTSACGPACCGSFASSSTSRGFLEVETPILSADTVVDRHLDPFSLQVGPTGGKSQTFWLQTSPEFAMKRLLAAGAEAIYQVSRVFRQEEQGPLHNPEFTLVEWYRSGDDLRAGMTIHQRLVPDAPGRGPAELLSYAEAFQRHAGLDPHAADLATLARLRGSATRHPRKASPRTIAMVGSIGS